MSDAWQAAAIVGAALLLRLFVLELDIVRGGSMLDTLRTGDLLLVLRPGAIRRFQVVICHYPGRRSRRLPFLKQHFVKRVVGLPGETVELQAGALFVNGAEVPQPFLSPARCQWAACFGPVTLGADEYLVLGDHRDASNDSRSVGPLPRRMLRGRAVAVLFPPRRLKRL